MRRLLIALVLLAGCGSEPTRIDCTTEETFDTTMQTVISELSREQKGELARLVLERSLADYATSRFIKKQTFSAEHRPATNVLYSDFDGLTGEQVIAHLKKQLAAP